MITRVKSISNSIFGNPLAILFVLLVTTEFIYKVLIKEFGIDFKISAGFKVMLQGLFFLQIVKTNYKTLRPLLVLLGCFFLGQLGNVDTPTLQKNLWFFDKYIFILLALMYVNTLENRSAHFRGLAICFEGFMIVNSIAIFLGFILQINLFETYSSARFGYDGLILRSGAASYIYIIGLFYAVHQVFVVKSKQWLLLVVTVLASFLLGTKAIVIGWVFVILYVMFLYNWHKNRVVQLLFLALCAILIIFWEPLLEYAFSLSDTFKRLYEQEGLFTAIFSLRDVHLMEEMIPLMQEQWTWKNYLFGGGFNMHWRSQFGLLDLFYFFGIVGMGVYLWTFWKNFVTFRRSIFTNMVLGCLFVLMALSAHFFYETILAFYLVFLKGYFEETSKSAIIH